MTYALALNRHAPWRISFILFFQIITCEVALLDRDGNLGVKASTEGCNLRILQRLRGGVDDDEDGIDNLIQDAYAFNKQPSVPVVTDTPGPWKRQLSSDAPRDFRESTIKRPRFASHLRNSTLALRNGARSGRGRNVTLYSNLNAKYQVRTSGRTVNSTALKPTRPVFNNRPDNFTAVKGNFNSYYGYRKASAMNSSIGKVLKPGVWGDPRLDLLKAEFFKGKTCLDIGCNAGYLTMSIAYLFECKSMIGIDCDAALVQQAKRVKKNIKWDFEKEGRSKCPVYFQHEDFITNDHFRDVRYDVITCFSVTKWVHLVHGDEGIKKMFRKCFDLLQDDGILILEPQPWRSYHNKRKVSAEIEAIYNSIRIRPNLFVNETLPSAGFLVEDLGEMT
ncbi:hypothetical protein GUITHDRAFT_141309 [Guillardia theta CCMP2712]|uniref:RNA methyltransferase n=1 Tax=Guillardia theta (strain CCMP2712) TaxID=905079 RepID=L1J247_GUITC|nr:hypothetical protein GUITHDRAFT_141309 [Guillardia theta CCMP2712]EKX42362.1 hypothetical protein GUITHDRAFT_141309 [Guillardia theta CCMP2712]|eukprot:XP_005829342.1 hypothetical protein GUITHDRAFT_141309 [Guillardia theta CCMP2712]